MNPIEKIIVKLRRNAANNEITVLTSEEANAVYQYLDDLENRIETKELKFMAICEQTYQMVKINRDMRKQLEELLNASAD